MISNGVRTLIACLSGLLLSTMLACGVDNGPCVPGDQKVCACPDGSSSAQICAPGGDAWEACQCNGGGGGGNGGSGAGGDGRCFNVSGQLVCVQTSNAGPEQSAVPGSVPIPPNGTPPSASLTLGGLNVPNQGNCGSCTAFATRSAMGLRAVAQGHAFTDFSEAHVWYIAGFGSGDCETGSAIMEVVGSNEASKQSTVPFATWPYDSTHPKDSLDAIPAAQVLSDDGVAYVQEYLTVGYHDMGDIRSAIAQGFAPVIGVPVYRDSGWETDGHIQLPPAGPELRGWHAIALTGYDDATQLVTFVNSWGAGFGNSGYGAMDYAFIKTYSSGGVAISQLAFAGVDGSCNGVSCPACTKCATGQCVADAAQNGGSCGSGKVCANGQCVTQCGNSLCDPGENCGNCIADCPCAAGASCQNGMCKGGGGEVCGNGNCVAPGENCASCPGDCACAAGKVCQNSQCVLKCGNGVCEAGEDCSSCPGDCACGGGQACINQSCQSCGQSGQACCPPANNCAAPNTCNGGVCGCNGSCANKCGGASDGCGGTCNGACGAGQKCSSQTCVSCNYTKSSLAGIYTCTGPGPHSMAIQGTFDGSGNLTVSATKSDGSGTFGNGDYYVWVFDPNSGDPTQQCRSFNAQKAHIVVSGSPSQITFPAFASQLVCGGPDKGYCVTKAGGGDNAWFCSDELKTGYN